MAYDGEGTIYIEAASFWSFVHGFMPKTDAETAFGPPRLVDGDIVVDYAFGTESHPETWAKKPHAVKQMALEKRLPAHLCQKALSELVEEVGATDLPDLMTKLRNIIAIAKLADTALVKGK